MIGPGRAGTAMQERFRAHAIDVRLLRRTDARSATAEAVLLAVPDRVICDVAATVPAGPRIGTLSGSAPLASLGDRPGRFILHPMQTIVAGGGADQLDGAWVGITASDTRTEAWVRRLVERIGLHPLSIPDDARPLPHIACVFASNLLIAPLVAALRTCDAAGIDPGDAERALRTLAGRAVENALAAGPTAAPTGPLARGDRATIVAHRRALAAVDPDLDAAYVGLSRLALAQVDPSAAEEVRPALDGVAEVIA